MKVEYDLGIFYDFGIRIPKGGVSKVGRVELPHINQKLTYHEIYFYLCPNSCMFYKLRLW